MLIPRSQIYLGFSISFLRAYSIYCKSKILFSKTCVTATPHTNDQYFENICLCKISILLLNSTCDCYSAQSIGILKNIWLSKYSLIFQMLFYFTLCLFKIIWQVRLIVSTTCYALRMNPLFWFVAEPHWFLDWLRQKPK